jgi:hypothetical protein
MLAHVVERSPSSKLRIRLKDPARNVRSPMEKWPVTVR